MSVEDINNCFRNGYLHDALFYNIDKNIVQIDPNKISYNNYYKSFDFYENKFKGDYTFIPGFYKVIENMSEVAIKNDVSPLKELEEKAIFDENENKVSSNR